MLLCPSSHVSLTQPGKALRNWRHEDPVLKAKCLIGHCWSFVYCTCPFFKSQTSVVLWELTLCCVPILVCPLETNLTDHFTVVTVTACKVSQRHELLQGKPTRSFLSPMWEQICPSRFWCDYMRLYLEYTPQSYTKHKEHKSSHNALQCKSWKRSARLHIFCFIPWLHEIK